MMIYQEGFPSNERQTLSKIAERVEGGKSQLLVGILNDEVVVMALLWNFMDSPFELLDYLAVKEGFRGKQLGAKMFRFLLEKATQNNRFLILEVEHPQKGFNTAQRQKRVQFYLNNGAYLLSNVPYILPSLDGTAPTEMQLMMAPQPTPQVIEPETIKNLIARLYLEIYEKPQGDSGLASLIETIPSKILVTNTLSL